MTFAPWAFDFVSCSPQTCVRAAAQFASPLDLREVNTALVTSALFRLLPHALCLGRRSALPPRYVSERSSAYASAL